MADYPSPYSTSPAPSSVYPGSEKMTGTSTPLTEQSEPPLESKPDTQADTSSTIPLRLPKSQQDPQNEPIQIPKIMADISFTEDPAILARGLEGKCVDEFGNILEWDGTVLGRVQGDLPSMVGRSVSNDGRIRDAAGDLAGHVSENYINSGPSQEDHSNKRLKIDHTGTIYDQDGAVVGRMKDHSKENNSTSTPAEGCARCRERERSSDRSNDTDNKSGAPPSNSHEDAKTDGAANVNVPPHRTATPSPSDIYLDVKSTHDGIQLIIKIPTVFNRDHHNSR